MALSALPLALLAALVSTQSVDAVACSSDIPASLNKDAADVATATVQASVFGAKDFKYCENPITISDSSQWRLTCTATLYPSNYIRVEEPNNANPMAYYCNAPSEADGLDAKASCGAGRCFSMMLTKSNVQYTLKMGLDYFKIKDNVVCSLKQEKTVTTYEATPAATSAEKVLKAAVQAGVPDVLKAASKAVSDTVTEAVLKTELAKITEVKKIVTVSGKKVQVSFREFEVAGTNLLLANSDYTDTKIVEFRKVFRKDATDTEHLGMVGAKYQINPAIILKAKFTSYGKVSGTIEYKFTGVDSFIAAVVKLGFESQKFTHTLKNLELTLGTLPASDKHTCGATNNAICELIATEIKKADFSKKIVEEVFKTTKESNIYFLQEKIKAEAKTKIAPKDYFGFLFNNLINSKVADLTTFGPYRTAVVQEVTYATSYKAKLGLEGTPADNFKATTTLTMEAVDIDTSAPNYKFELKIANMEVATTTGGNANPDKLKNEVIFEVKVTFNADYKTAQVTAATVKGTSSAAILAITQTSTTALECVTAHQGDNGNANNDYCKKWKDFLVTNPKILEKFADNVKTDAIVKLFYDYVMKPILPA